MLPLRSKKKPSPTFLSSSKIKPFINSLMTNRWKASRALPLLLIDDRSLLLQLLQHFQKRSVFRMNGNALDAFHLFVIREFINGLIFDELKNVGDGFFFDRNGNMTLFQILRKYGLGHQRRGETRMNTSRN